MKEKIIGFVKKHDTVVFWSIFLTVWLAGTFYTHFLCDWKWVDAIMKVFAIGLGLIFVIGVSSLMFMSFIWGCKDFPISEKSRYIRLAILLSVFGAASSVLFFVFKISLFWAIFSPPLAIVGLFLFFGLSAAAAKEENESGISQPW